MFEFDYQCLFPRYKRLCKMTQMTSSSSRRYYQLYVFPYTFYPVYGHVRVVRSCGYITDESKDDGECLSRSGTHDVRAKYCSCTSDLCNSVESLRTPSLLPLASLLTAVLATPSLLLSCPFAQPRTSLSNIA